MPELSEHLLIAAIAKVAHQANAAYCETLGDYSQSDWEFAPEWQKQSAIQGVRFHLSNPDALPSASHENWMKAKIELGWKYGTVKDADEKLHPCIVDYKDLPIEQKVKDSLFSGIVKTFTAHL